MEDYHDFGGSLVDPENLSQGDIVMSETGEPVMVVSVRGRVVSVVGDLDLEVPHGVKVRRLSVA